MKQASSDYDMAQRALDTVRERLAMPVVREALGERGVQLLAVAEMAAVPVVEDGRLIPFAAWQTCDVFPVLMMPRERRYKTTMTTMMPLQHSIAADQIAGHYRQRHVDESTVRSAMAGLDQLCTMARPEREIGFPRAASGSRRPTVAALHDPLRSAIDGRLEVAGRPHIILVQSNPAILSSSLVHELSHALDTIQSSVVELPDEATVRQRRIRTELAAYATEYAVGSSLNAGRRWWQRPLVPYQEVGTKIEGIRQRWNGAYTSATAFEVGDEIIEDLADDDLLRLITG